MGCSHNYILVALLTHVLLMLLINCCKLLSSQSGLQHALPVN